MIEYFVFELGCSNSEKGVKMRSKQQASTHVVKSTWHLYRNFPVVESKATAGKRVMTSPEVIFTFYYRTTA